jgi:hypothetical protein
VLPKNRPMQAGFFMGRWWVLLFPFIATARVPTSGIVKAENQLLFSCLHYDFNDFLMDDDFSALVGVLLT